ncbi:predicted protein [Uncinocarpus reesii 1704]|uniref:Uncharacterized protein n=1 Tax=Uncinocarpus reesii (strain UAMH 1704) TaxID=336963 RepID=C4JNN8_UNCRE|nr:uncharacterized protein UREG_03036 [Uncinocarpus reesii 1704]EEP78191.1 predicted protein [Uncinocarpus reesii 1704]
MADVNSVVEADNTNKNVSDDDNSGGLFALIEKSVVSDEPVALTAPAATLIKKSVVLLEELNISVKKLSVKPIIASVEKFILSIKKSLVKSIITLTEKSVLLIEQLIIPVKKSVALLPATN